MINRPESVIGLEDGSYLVRGHVSDDEAVAAIRKEFDSRFELDAGCFTEHCYMRAIPCPGWSAYDYRYEYSAPGRGAFACTAVWV